MPKTTETSELTPPSSNSMRLLNRLLDGPIGLALLFGGVWLLTLGGSPYYLLAGVANLFAGLQLWRLRTRGAWRVAGVALSILLWALGSAGRTFGRSSPGF